MMTETLQYKVYNHIGYSQLRELGLNINGMSISIFVIKSTLIYQFLPKTTSLNRRRTMTIIFLLLKSMIFKNIRIPLSPPIFQKDLGINDSLLIIEAEDPVARIASKPCF